MHRLCITNLTYDAQGNMILAEFDEDGDSKADHTVRSEFNTSGKLTYEEPDYDGDGNPEFAVHYHYDLAGRMSAQYYDNDGNWAMLLVTVKWFLLSISHTVEYAALFHPTALSFGLVLA